MRRSCLGVSLALADLLISSLAASGQAPGGSAQAAQPAAVSTAPALQVNANLVLVDVVVTEHDKPVYGLKRGDFKVFEDGEERPIASFDEHRPAGNESDVQTAAAEAAAVQAALPRDTYTNIPFYPQASAVNVLLLDELNTPPIDLPELRTQMIHYLATVKPGTSLALFVLTSRLRLVEGFTTDVGQLAGVLEQRKAKPQSAKSSAPSAVNAAAAKPDTGLVAKKVTDEADREAVRQEEDDLVQSGMARSAALLEQGLVAQDDQKIEDKVGTTLAALNQLARYLSAIPGRKNLIWLSGAFPILLHVNGGFDDFEPAVRRTMNLLAEARVAVYPVDAQGLMPPPGVDVRIQNPGSAAWRTDARAFATHETNNRETMNLTAELTGGKVYFNTNGFKDAIADAVQSGSSYYTIGYVPGDKPFNGQFRKIDVRLDKGHDTLDYRNGYYADPPDKPSEHSVEAANLITEAALHGAPPMTQILFKAQVLPATDPLFKKVRFPSGPAGAMAATMTAPRQLYIVILTG